MILPLSIALALMTGSVYGATIDSYVSINDGKNTDGSLIANSSATYDGAMAIGPGATTKGKDALTLGVNANALGVRGVAIGKDANVGGDSVAVGSYASTHGMSDAIAVGNKATVNNAGGIAIGASATTTDSASYAMAVGRAAKAEGRYATALGYLANAKENAVAVGRNTTADTGAVVSGYKTTSKEYGVSVGNQSVAGRLGISTGYSAQSGESSIAMGYKADASKDHAIALGQNTVANKSSIVIGGDSSANGLSAVSVGPIAEANADSSVAIGAKSYVIENGQDGTAIGRGAYIGKQIENTNQGPDEGISDITRSTTETDASPRQGKEYANSTSLGYSAKSFGYQDTALGAGAEAYKSNSLAVGILAKAKDDYSTAIGKESNAGGDHSIALGLLASTGGLDSIAVGRQATVNDFVMKSMALGSDSQVKSNNSVALGAGSVADTGDTNLGNAYASGEAFNATNGVVSVGSKNNYRRITNVAGGLADNDAVNVLQLKTVAGNVDINTQNIADLADIVNQQGQGVQNDMDALRYELKDTRKEIHKVGAGSAALAGLHPLDFDPDDKFTLATSGGFYKDAQAFALGGFYRPNENTMFSLATTLGNNDNMVNLGASFKIGSTKTERKFKESFKTAPISTVYVLEDKVHQLEQENADMKAKIAVLMEKLGL